MMVKAVLTSLAALGPSIESCRDAQAKRFVATAPRFTPFAYVRNDEFSISRIIRDLLDPRGPHSQGPIFLRSFLDVLGFQSLRRISPHASVATESPTADGRRIDIVIRDTTWIIGIENKPWAKDQVSQIADYLRAIGSLGVQSAHLIYLTRDGRLPSVESIDKRACDAARVDGKLRLVSYAQIIDWLDACHERTVADRVRSFVADFRQYLREEVMNTANRLQDNAVIDALLAEGNRGYLPAALEIALQKDGIQKALLDRLLAGLRQKLPQWEIEGEPTKEDDGLALKPPNNQGWFFCLELDSEAQKWMYGIKRDNPQIGGARFKALTQLGNRLHSRYQGSDGPNDWWLVWLQFDNRTAHDPDSYSQWENSVQPWVDMANGMMAENIAALAIELSDATVELSRR
jgi:hypothetical protein